MEEFLAYALWFAFELALIQSGRLAVRLLSFGRWRAERMREVRERPAVVAGALWFQANGTRVVTVDGARIVGLALLAAGVVALIVR